MVWKAVEVILKRHFTASIYHHNSLHRFWAGHGMETTTLKVKLLQKVMDIREDVLHAIFLDLHKAYDALDM